MNVLDFYIIIFLYYLNFHPLVFLSSYRVGEKYPYLFILEPNILQILLLNPFKPEFTIVTFIHYKPRIAVAILHLQRRKVTRSVWKIKKKRYCYHLNSSMKMYVLEHPDVGNYVILPRCKMML